MKHKILRIIAILLLVCFIILLYFNYKDNNKSNINNINNTPVKTPEPTVVEEKININELRKQYNNNDIIAYIEIPEVVETIVMQGEDNNYYLNHDVNHNYDIKGSVILDYRNTISDRKLLLYGHSGKEQDLPFLPLKNYTDKSYYDMHNTIYLYTVEGKKTYKIFSAYIESNDYDYVNLNNFNGLTYYEHINKLKSKSLYDTGITLKEDDHIIILQTCSTNDIDAHKYYLVIGKEE